ncbi:MAG TPA: type VI secretion system tube protein Hcp [Candidatus Binatia bacterium]|nr:type VI secretion system tube protein Hcp [Candidatus Binatia bacterium]
MFDCFLELQGIKGESKDKGHPDTIKIESFNWGGSQQGSMHAGGGGGTGRASFNDLSLTKRMDKASPTLWQFMSLGKHFETGKLFVRKAGGNPVDYVVLEMTKVIVSNISFGGSSAGSEQVDEQVTLNFSKFKISYTPQKEDGTKDAAVEFGFDIKQNAQA